MKRNKYGMPVFNSEGLETPFDSENEKGKEEYDNTAILETMDADISALGLFPLKEITGTPKQIPWAEKIRAEFVHQLRNCCERKNVDASKSRKIMEFWQDVFIENTSGRWWIDRRYKGLYELIGEWMVLNEIFRKEGQNGSDTFNPFYRDLHSIHDDNLYSE